jgi:hypothetical protein
VADDEAEEERIKPRRKVPSSRQPNRKPACHVLDAHFWIVRLGYKPSRRDGGAVLELYFGNQLQESKKCCAFFQSQFLSEFIISGYPHIDQAFPVLAAFWRQCNVNCSARFCFSLRHKPFVNH